jgi:hypothetical protein
MPIIEIKVQGFQFERCRHKWIPNNIKQEPEVCPRCKSVWWNIPKRKPSDTSKQSSAILFYILTGLSLLHDSSPVV